MPRGPIPARFEPVLDSPYFASLHAYNTGLSGPLGSSSTAFRYVTRLLKHCRPEVEQIAIKVQDAFQLAVGASARERVKAIFLNTRKSIVPSAECFVGVIRSSEIFAKLPVMECGRLIPYLNARLYMNATKISGISELVGLIKTAEFDGDVYYFRLAGELGFFDVAPGKNEFCANFRAIDEYLGACGDLVNRMLIDAGLPDLTVFSIDSTNIPVDKKDKTGSIGTGSRGTFYGHKLTLAVSGECFPIVGTLSGGRQADVTLFGGVMAPVVELATETGTDPWAAVKIPPRKSRYFIWHSFPPPIKKVRPHASSHVMAFAMARATSAGCRYFILVSKPISNMIGSILPRVHGGRRGEAENDGIEA